MGFRNRILSSAVGGVAAFAIVVASAFAMLLVAGQPEALSRFLALGWIAATLAAILALPLAPRLGQVPAFGAVGMLLATIGIYVLQVPFHVSSDAARVVRYLIFFVHLPLCILLGAICGGYAEKGLRDA